MRKNSRLYLSCVAALAIYVQHGYLQPSRAASDQVLIKVADIPMPGPAVRFDYQSLDAEHGRLYIAHMNADQLVVFDTEKRQVVANLDGFKRVHGVIAVPEIDRVYASVTGEHQVAAVDMNTPHNSGEDRTRHLSGWPRLLTDHQESVLFRRAWWCGCGHRNRQ